MWCCFSRFSYYVHKSWLKGASKCGLREYFARTCPDLRKRKGWSSITTTCPIYLRCKGKNRGGWLRERVEQHCDRNWNKFTPFNGFTVNGGFCGIVVNLSMYRYCRIWRLTVLPTFYANCHSRYFFKIA